MDGRKKSGNQWQCHKVDLQINKPEKMNTFLLEMRKVAFNG